jgi:hypothetical protein
MKKWIQHYLSEFYSLVSKIDILSLMVIIVVANALYVQSWESVAVLAVVVGGYSFLYKFRRAQDFTEKQGAGMSRKITELENRMSHLSAAQGVKSSVQDRRRF